MEHIGIGHYFLREYDASTEVLSETIRTYPSHTRAYFWLAAALGQLGRVEEGREALQKAIAIAPKSFEMFVGHRDLRYRPEDYQHMLEGLRKAGWEG